MDSRRRYAVFLRGVNVGGRTSVSMARLRETCEAAGCHEVATSIQSGNVVLTIPLAAAELRERLERAIDEALGVSTAVAVRTAAELAELVEDNPFAGADERRLHVAFLAESVDPAALGGLADVALPPDELAARGAHVYLHLPDGVGRSKTPAALERRLSVPITIRNWRTVMKLAELVVESGAVGSDGDLGL